MTDIGETIGRIWVSPTHDRAGNMLVIPRPSDPRESYTATYDAWHRLVKLEQLRRRRRARAGGRVCLRRAQLPHAEADLHRRRTRRTRHFYYSSRWQVLEERVDDTEAAACQYVWGRRYIDDLVLRDRDTTGIGILDERFYALQDANWNVISISTAYCQIQEHYTYTAYGTMEVRTPVFQPTGAPSLYAWSYTYTHPASRRRDRPDVLIATGCIMRSWGGL